MKIHLGHELMEQSRIDWLSERIRKLILRSHMKCFDLTSYNLLSNGVAIPLYVFGSLVKTGFLKI